MPILGEGSGCSGKWGLLLEQAYSWELNENRLLFLEITQNVLIGVVVSCDGVVSVHQLARPVERSGLHCRSGVQIRGSSLSEGFEVCS